MAQCEYDTVTITTAADGTATEYTQVINGKIIAVKYVKDDYAAGVDFTITTDLTGQDVWVEDDVNADKTVNPRVATHDTIGAASLYAAAGEPVENYIRACTERIKIVIAQGGDTKSGAFTVIWER